MKKQIFLIGILFVIIFIFSFIQVKAYSPHYLPGGKNYLSEDNFVIEDTYYKTDAPFLVKPYTDYTLTIPRSYADEQWSEIEMVLYKNNEVLTNIYLDSDSFTYYNLDGEEWYYFSFKTTSETNYIDLTFEDVSNYFETNGLVNFQMEEGTIFTGYETYIEGALEDTSAPYFQNAGTIVSYVDSPITVSEIQSALVAYDAIDGDVTNNITLVSDNYTTNNTILGAYSIIFEVSDSSGNTSQIAIDVDVVDVLKPVFSDLGTIQAVYPNTYSASDILGMLSASDNYDGDISSEIVLLSDDYTANSSTVGTYQMVFTVTDSSGNMESYTQNIEVVDNQGPIISGITTITVGYDSVITQNDITNNLSYTDNYDSVEDLTLILESDTYSSNPGVLGIYSMVYSITDSSGNKTEQEISINVVDELGPVVYFNSSIIQTYNDTVMALPDFLQLLKATDELDKYTDYYVTIKYDSYTKNATVPGVYHMSLNFKNSVGDELDKDFEVRVIERPFDYIQIGDNPIIDNSSFLEKYSHYLIQGTLGLFLIVSNIIWVVIIKRKSH